MRSGVNGIEHWQWFIAVEPSVELAEHLITGNAFGLIAITDGASRPHSFGLLGALGGFAVLAANPGMFFKLITLDPFCLGLRFGVSVSPPLFV